MSYYGVTFRSQDGELLTHYGVKGQKWGVRNYTNVDGTLTTLGRQHYGIGQGVRNVYASAREAAHNYRVKRFGSNSTKVMEKKPQKLSKKEQAERKARTKAIVKAAAGVTVAAAVAYGLHRYNKTTKNLIQVAKNKVHFDYESTKDLAKTPTEKTIHENWKQLDMMGINSRRSAKRALRLKGMRKTSQFIKNNNLANRKTSEIIEKRTGKIVEGMHRSRLTGKMKPYSERMRRRIAERMVKQGHFD